MDGLVSGRSGQLVAVGEGAPLTGYLVDAQDPAELIGTKGSRTVDRMTSMVIAVTSSLLAEQAATIGNGQSGIGLVLGTSTGSINSITEFVKDTFVQAKPYFVKPADFPNTVMNGAAGRTAIWHGLRGLNSTVAGGHVTALAALRYAARMIRRGYAETLLVGAVEELSSPMAWAATKIRGGNGQTPLGEGCVMFLLEDQAATRRRGRRPLASLVDFESTVVAPRSGPAERARALAAAITTLLTRSGTAAADLWAISLAQSGNADLDQAELTAIDDVLAGAQPRRIVPSRQIGDTFSASGAFQVAALLACAQERSQPPGSRLALTTSLGVDGAAACSLIRV